MVLNIARDFWNRGKKNPKKQIKPRKILLMQHVPFSHKGSYFSDSSAAFGPTSSEGHVLDEMEKEQANISSWFALFCWLHKAYVTDEHFGRL